MNTQPKLVRQGIVTLRDSDGDVHEVAGGIAHFGYEDIATGVAAAVVYQALAYSCTYLTSDLQRQKAMRDSCCAAAANLKRTAVSALMTGTALVSGAAAKCTQMASTFVTRLGNPAGFPTPNVVCDIECGGN